MQGSPKLKNVENAFQAFYAMEHMHNGMFGIMMSNSLYGGLFRKRIKGATAADAATIYMEYKMLKRIKMTI